MKHVKGPDFPTGGDHPRPLGDPRGLPTRAAAASRAARAHIEELRGGKRRSSSPSCPTGQQGRRQRRDQEDRRPRPREGDHRDLRPRATSPTARDADPDRAQARRDPAGGAEQALQAHAAADHLRRTTRSRWSTACRGRSRCSSSIHHYLDHQREVVVAPLQARAPPARGARAHPRGLLIALEQPRRGDRADPRRRATASSAREQLIERFKLERDPGLGDPRPAPARS